MFFRCINVFIYSNQGEMHLFKFKDKTYFYIKFCIEINHKSDFYRVTIGITHFYLYLSKYFSSSTRLRSPVFEKGSCWLKARSLLLTFSVTDHNYATVWDTSSAVVQWLSLWMNGIQMSLKPISNYQRSKWWNMP